MTTLSIVVPVRDVAHLLPPLLIALTNQVQPHDEIIMVDDGSTDSTVKLCRDAGVHVIERNESGGPYTARNDGWRRAQGDVVVFTDARCRPRTGWLSSLRACFADDGADLAFGPIEILPGQSTASRVAALRDHMRTEIYVEQSIFLPWFPTANLAVRRQCLEEVDGFRTEISGNDADLCWRVQTAGHRTVRVSPETHMDWVPRDKTSDLLRQWAKYGDSAARLALSWEPAGAQVRPPSEGPRAMFHQFRTTVRGHLRDGVSVGDAFADAAAGLAFDVAYRKKLGQGSVTS